MKTWWLPLQALTPCTESSQLGRLKGTRAFTPSGKTAVSVISPCCSRRLSPFWAHVYLGLATSLL